jgi:hypothetical protein
MSILGIHFRLKIGASVPEIAPLKLNEALQSVEVTHNYEGRSAFQLSFQIGRGLFDLFDYALVSEDSILQPFKRVQLIVYFGLDKQVLMDGIITNRQLAPSDEPGASTLTITGEDVSLMMDLEQRSDQNVNMDDRAIVEAILKKYGDYKFQPNLPKGEISVINPAPEKDDKKTSQPTGVTDLAFIKTLAQRYGFITYVRPGEDEGINEFFWGQPDREGEQQEDLLVNMGPQSNVSSISFSYNGLAPTAVRFTHKDGGPDTVKDARLKPAFVKRPARPMRIEFMDGTEKLTKDEATKKAQGMVDKASQEVVTASGELNALRYGGMLQPHGRVNVRGVGYSYDGTYYVKSVTHSINIRQGTYRQSFSLTREGEGQKVGFFG